MPTERAAQVLLDTHALLWWQAGSPRLAPSALTALSAAARVLISPISCWEVSMLVTKGRVTLDRPTATWIRDLLAQDRIATADLTAQIAVDAAELPDFHGDPADRLLYATARWLRIPLISKDDRLRQYAENRRDCAVHW